MVCCPANCLTPSRHRHLVSRILLHSCQARHSRPQTVRRQRLLPHPLMYELSRAHATHAALAALADATELCEGVQFVMGAFRQQPDSRTISFTFGLQDCETAILTLSVQRIIQLLEFGS